MRYPFQKATRRRQCLGLPAPLQFFLYGPDTDLFKQLKR